MIFNYQYNIVNNEKPPTLYAILNSIVNFGEDEKTKIKNLASAGRSKIFDFEYPLTSTVEKEEFETLILNKFLMRRIGYDTVTAFKIALSVKLNEIMPRYNKMFDMLDGWNIFNSGEVETRIMSESGTGTTSGTNSGSSTDKTRYAELPQNKLSDLENSKYVSDYTINDNISSGTNSSSQSQSNQLNETITRTPSDKLRLYNEFMENKNNIYTMIFNDLSSLFYGLI